MIEKKSNNLGAGDILSTSNKKNVPKKSVHRKKVSKKVTPTPTVKKASAKEAKLLKLAEIGKKAKIVRKESNEIAYINIEQFFTERNIDRKYFKPFRIYMRHRTYQHSLDDFDKWFDKYLHRFN